MKYSKGEKVKLIQSVEKDWEGWGFENSIIIRPVIGLPRQYLIQAKEGTGITICVKEFEILPRE